MSFRFVTHNQIATTRPIKEGQKITIIKRGYAGIPFNFEVVSILRKARNTSYVQVRPVYSAGGK